jgi:hypothetical protein
MLGAMIRAATIALAGPLLAGCVTGLFDSEPPQVETAVLYAEDVCDEAGDNSQSCADAQRQVNVRCFRTLGTVDCYESEAPFGPSHNGRAFARPIDGRPLSPSPG